MRNVDGLRPPNIPWTSRVKYIASWWWMGCEPEDKWLYIQFSQAPAGRIALMLLTPDLVDIVKDWWKPKGLRTGRHGRKGKKGSRGLSRFWDVEQAIGDMLPDAQELHYNKHGSGQRWFFHLTDIVERVTWNIMVVEMATDLTFSTIWGIISADNSQCPGFGRYYRSDEHNAILNTGMQMAAFPVGTYHYAVNVGEHNQFRVAVGEGWWNACFTTSLGEPFNPNRQAQIMMFDGAGGNEILAESGTATINKGSWTNLSCEGTFIGPGEICTGIRNDGSMEAIDSVFTVFGGKYIR